MHSLNDQDEDVTRHLVAIRNGDGDSSRLMEIVYERLRAVAHRFFEKQRSGHTLEPTALVHEVYLRMVDQSRLDCRDRAHFVAICARAMRNVLADHERRRRATKRGGDWKRVTLNGVTSKSADPIDVLDVDDALTRLAELSERQARVAEYRVFSGMGLAEIAEVLGVSRRTVSDDWAMARAWLSARLSEGAEP